MWQFLEFLLFGMTPGLCIMGLVMFIDNRHFIFGNMFYYGRWVKKDYFKAKELYEQAIQKGSFFAIYNLAILYEEVHGVEHDFVKAKEHFESMT